MVAELDFTCPSASLGPPVHVRVQDFVAQPFHDMLPWARMSLRVRHQDIPLLLDMLR